MQSTAEMMAAMLAVTRELEQSRLSYGRALEENTHLKSELEQWKREAQRLDEALKRIKDLQKTPREHVDPNQIQLAFEQIAKELIALRPAPQKAGDDGDEPKRKGPRNRTPHGRGFLPEHLPVETIELKPKDLPLDAKPVGEDVSWRLGFRRASFYRLKIVRPRYAVNVETAPDGSQIVARMVPAEEASKVATTDTTSAEAATANTTSAEAVSADATSAATAVFDAVPAGAEAQPESAGNATEATERVRPPPIETTIVQACMPREIIDRGMPTADLLAYIIVSKFADKIPYNRQEGIIAREGVRLSRSTMCQWAGQADQLAGPLVSAMGTDARAAEYIMTDSTGTLVQANERCKKGYFWVYVSSNGHVIYRYSQRNNSDDPRRFFGGYKGIVLADATSTLDAICKLPDIDRAGCNSHARRYFFKAIDNDRSRALVGIGMYNRLFELEAEWKGLPPSRRLALRQEHSRPVFDGLIGWSESELPRVDDPSPIRAALFYLLNNRAELGRFLTNGSIPIHNNRSELELRRLVIGRANWLFVGSDDTAPWTCTFSSLIGSCGLHGLDAHGYLRDLFRVLPHWPARRLIELCPRNWAATRARLDLSELALPLGPLTVPPAD
jgi:transposase